MTAYPLHLSLLNYQKWPEIMEHCYVTHYFEKLYHYKKTKQDRIKSRLLIIYSKSCFIKPKIQILLKCAKKKCVKILEKHSF